jgi:gluconolactonase
MTLKFLKKIKHFFYPRALHNKGYLNVSNQSFLDLVSLSAKIKRIATGFIFTEGPVWYRKKCLLSSDIPGDTIWRLKDGGKPKVFRKPSYNANGLALDRQGRLIACEHGSRRVVRIEENGAASILADTYNGKRLNSPNDVIEKSDEAIYFTDPPYGITPEIQEQKVQGVYRISPDCRELTLLTDELSRPNGLVFSVDEKKLYISNSEPEKYIRVYDVRQDGTLNNGQIFQDMDIDVPGLPDGMKLDHAGNIYCTGPSGIWVIDPSGKHLGTIVMPEIPSNCAWGGYRLAKSLYYGSNLNL